MPSLVLKVSAKTLAVAATALHDGTSSPGYSSQVHGFAVQATSDTYIGGSGVTGATNGFLIPAGQTGTFNVPPMRAGIDDYELTKIYYIGGPCILTVEDNE